MNRRFWNLLTLSLCFVKVLSFYEVSASPTKEEFINEASHAYVNAMRQDKVWGSDTECELAAKVLKRCIVTYKLSSDKLSKIFLHSTRNESHSRIEIVFSDGDHYQAIVDSVNGKYTIQDVAQDGNCLFSAISVADGRKENFHSTLRARVYDLLEKDLKKEKSKVRTSFELLVGAADPATFFSQLEWVPRDLRSQILQLLGTIKPSLPVLNDFDLGKLAGSLDELSKLIQNKDSYKEFLKTSSKKRKRSEFESSDPSSAPLYTHKAKRLKTDAFIDDSNDIAILTRSVSKLKVETESSAGKKFWVIGAGQGNAQLAVYGDFAVL